MVMFINILSVEIAEKTYTSKATVIRFAKAMGYDGWKEFMKDYIAEIQYRKNFEKMDSESSGTCICTNVDILNYGQLAL